MGKTIFYQKIIYFPLHCLHIGLLVNISGNSIQSAFKINDIESIWNCQGIIIKIQPAKSAIFSKKEIFGIYCLRQAGKPFNKTVKLFLSKNSNSA